MKNLIILSSLFFALNASAQLKVKSPTEEARQLKKAEKREKINQLIKQEEEGALIFQKQSVFAIKFNTDGWAGTYEHGKYKTMTKTNLYWVEIGEHRHPKEEKVPTMSASQGFIIVSNYIYGKRNNLLYVNAGIGQQKLLGGKGNKNGVAVSAIYGGGLSAGLLKPYYIEIDNPNTNKVEEIKYDNNDLLFLDPLIIQGRGNFFKGFNEISFVPGAHAKAAIRFDYGRYNEVVSALEVGVNATYYSKEMPILLNNPAQKFFFNAYLALAFGRRK